MMGGEKKLSKSSSLPAKARFTCELKTLPEIDWDNARNTLYTIGVEPRQKAPDTLDDLMNTLTEAKMEEARTLKKTMKKSASHTAARRLAESVPDEVQAILNTEIRQLPSQFTGSATYSCGPGYQKPRHLRGKLKMPVLEPRDAGYVPSGTFNTPGPGHYDTRHYVGKDVGEAGGGGTGGWHQKDHQVFLRTFNGVDFRQEATPEFFDRLAVLLPHVPRRDLVEHVKWFADYELHKMKLEHTRSRFSEETRIAKDLGASQGFSITQELARQLEQFKGQRLDEFRLVHQRLMKFHTQAEAERKRWSLKDPSQPLDGFKPVQFSACAFGGGATQVEENHRQHPEFKKAPGWTWSASKLVHDPMDKQLTDLSHVRSSSALDVPGPGQYIGLHEQDRIMKRAPAYTMRKKFTGPMASLPEPDLEKCHRAGELEQRLGQAGAQKGEISISLMWDNSDDLDLSVLPPGSGDQSLRTLSCGLRSACGGTMDVCRGRDPGRGAAQPLENIFWPKFLGKDKVQKPAPPKGVYKIYMHAHPKKGEKKAAWYLRLQIGGWDHIWLNGVVKDEDVGKTVLVYSFKYDGPVDSSTKLQEHLVATQLRKPTYKIGTEEQHRESNSNEVHALSNKWSTPAEVGPGKYTHSTGMVTTQREGK
eukprot:TRINITY_DN25323_c0_g1_i1.p1 TRINITY_DN25323_c0_g1~~TRINITY_DN25323_c0_g1_i1.p1  ORF type:complete len:646 (-),score=161.62 TRINITY_DN25323_c0_g1_i1:117-2054(-)